MVRHAGEERRGGRYRIPPVEIVETGEALVLKAEMPGVDKEDFEIRIDDGELTISGKRKPVDSELRFVHVESDRSQYWRSFVLSDELNTANVHAKLDKGILTLTLGKKKELLPQKVTIAVE
jgi:HSP20 family protein